MEETFPVKGGATFPRDIEEVTASVPVGPFAPESKTGVPKIAERGASGRFTLPLIRIDDPALRAPRLHLPHAPGEQPRERRGLGSRRPTLPTAPNRPLSVIPAGAQRRAGI